MIAQNLLLLLGSLILALLCSEVLTRILFAFPAQPGFTQAKVTPIRTYAHELTPYNLNLRYKPTPNAFQYTDGQSAGETVLNQFNSGGFRDREFTIEKQEGTKRILFLGDSVVYGHAVALKDTLPKRLEDIYRENNQSVEVMNFGISGYETEQEVEFLKEAGLKYKPDLVLLEYCLNDSNYASFEMDWFHAKLDVHIQTPSRNWYRQSLWFLYRYSKLLNLLDRKFHIQNRFKFLRSYSEPSIFDYVRQRNVRNRDPENTPYSQLKEQILADAKRLGTSEGSLSHILGNIGFVNRDIGSHHWNVTANALRELKTIAEREGFPIIVIIFPFIQEMDRYPLESLHQFLNSEMTKMGFTVIDMKEWGKELHARHDRADISHDAIHFTPLSTKLAARFIYEQLEKLKALGE